MNSTEISIICDAIIKFPDNQFLTNNLNQAHNKINFNYTIVLAVSKSDSLGRIICLDLLNIIFL